MVCTKNELILSNFLPILYCQCPTTVVPFFGDQFFWGDRIHAIGVGPEPIPISELSVERLSEAITFMLQPEVIFTYFC